MMPQQNPLQIGIFGWVKCGKGIGGARQHVFRNVCFHIGEKFGVAPQPAHDALREKKFEEGAPTPIIPSVVIEYFTLRHGTRLEQFPAGLGCL